MARAKTALYIDEDLLRRAGSLAAQRGHAVEDVVEELLQRYVDVDDFMEAVWATSPDDLSEEESLELADREVHAVRRERAAHHSS